jgi:two-component system sensor histidine kinase HydH
MGVILAFGLKKSLRRNQYVSPYILIGAAVILLVVVFVSAVQDYYRQKAHMVWILTEKGAALIKAIEAGARTGMRGMRWGSQQIQILLEETARLPDVLYIAVISSDGEVLAHSDTPRIGSIVFPPGIEKWPPLSDRDNWQLTKMPSDSDAFEVYRQFQPLMGGGSHRFGHRGMRRQHGRMMGWQADSPLMDENKQHFILVGLNTVPFKDAQRAGLRQTAMLSGILLLMGFGGFLSMYWAQSYRAARKSLQDTTAFAEEVVSHLPIGLLATDNNDKIAFYNASAANITGIPRDQALGRFLIDVMPEAFGTFNDVVKQGRRIAEQELECAFSRKEMVPLSVSASKIVNAEGDDVGSVFIMRDLAEIRQLQAEVRKQEKMAAIGGLAAGVAHEIRNPLSSIKGMATYFRSKFPEGSDDQQAAAVMVQEVDRLNRSISELIEFARPTRLDRKETDIHALLKHSLQLIQQDAGSQNVEVKFTPADPHVVAFVDADRLLQCLLNIYLNALQAMPDGGNLSIRCQPAEEASFGISITDTGQGISAEHRSQIFDPYFTTKASGTGLGLAIVQRIIEAHHGDIEVRSDTGKGTQITLHLPIVINAD